jgi:amidase
VNLLSKSPIDLDFASATEVARAIRKHEISSLALTRRILKRIEKYNPDLVAISTLMKEEALKRAQEADEALDRGEIWGPLHGVPITIKDSFRIEGVITTAGIPDLATFKPQKDAVVVKRLRAAGAVILGHSNVPFMLGDWQSYNEIFGTSKNPWDLKLTPGGSTGGGAAALAAGLSYLSIGSDIAGSIRVPAAYCGVYGHKPSLGVIPRKGQIPPRPGNPSLPADMSVAGPLARSAADLKLALEILGGPIEEEAIAYRWTLPPARGTRLVDYHIGYVIDDPISPVLQEVKLILSRTIETLKNAGVTLVEGWPPGLDITEQYKAYLYLLYSNHARGLEDDKIDEMRALASKDDDSLEVMTAKAWTAPHKYFQQASETRLNCRAIWQKYFETFDAFLLPTTIGPAFPHDHSDPLEQRQIPTPEGDRPYGDLFPWIAFSSLSGHPTTSAPIGLTKNGLPISIQIIGPYLEDATPIDIAGKLADHIDGFIRPPNY